MSRYFTRDHEWIEVAGDLGTVGITDYAQGQLGDITFVEVPPVGQAVKAGEAVSVVELGEGRFGHLCPCRRHRRRCQSGARRCPRAGEHRSRE